MLVISIINILLDLHTEDQRLATNLVWTIVCWLSVWLVLFVLRFIEPIKTQRRYDIAFQLNEMAGKFTIVCVCVVWLCGY